MIKILLSILIIKSSAYNNKIYTRNLARENFRLVPFFAKPYFIKHRLNSDQKKELIQEGSIGFMYACRKYDENYGLKLSTYSKFWIRKYMDDYIKKLYKNQHLELNQDITYFDNEPIIHLECLNDDEYELIFKRFYQKIKLKDLANYYQVSKSTISNRINKSIQKLCIFNLNI